MESESSRYVLNSGHCRFGDNSNFDNRSKPESLDTSQKNSFSSLSRPILKSVNKNDHCDDVSLDHQGKELISQLSSLDSKDSVPLHILSYTSFVQSKDSIKETKNIKSIRSLKQMSSVIHRGTHLANKSTVVGEIYSTKDFKLGENISENFSHIKEKSSIIARKSYTSGDENDTSSDSLSENDTIGENISIVGVRGEKGLSSISENSFSSVTSTKTNRNFKRKKKNYKTLSPDAILRGKTSSQKNKLEEVSVKLSHNGWKEHKVKLNELSKNSHPLTFCSQKSIKKHCKKSKSHSVICDPRSKRENNRDKKNNQELHCQTIPSDNILSKNFDSRKHKHDKDKKMRGVKKCKNRSDYSKESHPESNLSPFHGKATGTFNSKGRVSRTINEQNIIASSSKSIIKKGSKHKIDGSSSSLCSKKKKVSPNDLINKENNAIDDLKKDSDSLKMLSKSYPKIIKESHNIGSSKDNTSDLLKNFCSMHDEQSYNICKRKHLKMDEVPEKRKKLTQDTDKTFPNVSQFKTSKKQSFQSLNFQEPSLLQCFKQKEKNEIYDSLSDIDPGIILDDDSDSFNFPKYFADNCEKINQKYLQFSSKANYFNNFFLAKECSFLFDIPSSFLLVENIFFNIYMKRLFEFPDLKLNSSVFVSNMARFAFGSLIEDAIYTDLEKESYKAGLITNLPLTHKKDCNLRKLFSNTKDTVANGECSPRYELKHTSNTPGLFQLALMLYEKHPKF